MPPDDRDPELDDLDTLNPDDASDPETLDTEDNPDDFDDDADQPGDTGDEPDLRAQGTEDDTGTPAGDRQQQPSRRDRRIETLAQRAREAERREKEANDRLNEMLRVRRETATQQPTGESAAQRAERRSRLTPEERITEDLRESEQRLNGQLQQSQLVAWETSDRTLFETKAINSPAHRRWKDRVEAEVQKLKERGQVGVARESILAYLLGKAVLDQQEKKGGGKRRDEAKRRIERNTTRPGAPRSDTSQQRRGGKSLEERLSNVSL